MDASAIVEEMTSLEAPGDRAWLERFHAGDRAVVETCYRDCFAEALVMASRVVAGVDAETVTHEVFYRLLSDRSMREGFRGGNLRAWISRVVTNAAIDHHRRRRREVAEEDAGTDGDTRGRLEEELEAKLMIERFRRDHLPEKWQSLFELRFLRQLPQRDAARELGMMRSTLAYQEQQVRVLLTDFLLASEAS